MNFSITTASLCEANKDSQTQYWTPGQYVIFLRGCDHARVHNLTDFAFEPGLSLSSYRPTRVTYYIVNKPLSQIIISKPLSIKLILHSMYFVPIFSLLYFFVTVVYIYTFSLRPPYPTD